jgi:hypothetical protein
MMSEIDIHQKFDSFDVEEAEGKLSRHYEDITEAYNGMLSFVNDSDHWVNV